MLNTQQAIAEQKRKSARILALKQQLTLGQPEQMTEERATGKRRKAMTV